MYLASSPFPAISYVFFLRVQITSYYANGNELRSSGTVKIPEKFQPLKLAGKQPPLRNVKRKKPAS